jgi:hypothetical protein
MLSGCEKTNLPLISSATAIGCEARMQLTRVGLDRSCVDAVPYWRCPPLSCLTHTFAFRSRHNGESHKMRLWIHHVDHWPQLFTRARCHRPPVWSSQRCAVVEAAKGRTKAQKSTATARRCYRKE